MSDSTLFMKINLWKIQRELIQATKVLYTFKTQGAPNLTLMLIIIGNRN